MLAGAFLVMYAAWLAYKPLCSANEFAAAQSVAIAVTLESITARTKARVDKAAAEAAARVVAAAEAKLAREAALANSWSYRVSEDVPHSMDLTI